jgi:hypothetical protein
MMEPAVRRALTLQRMPFVKYGRDWMAVLSGVMMGVRHAGGQMRRGTSYAIRAVMSTGMTPHTPMRWRCRSAVVASSASRMYWSSS